MPTEIMSAVRMQPMSQLQHHSPVLPIRLLTRGPDYLRRQIESGTPRSSLSAVERLAADKAKYVKSQQQQQQAAAAGGGGGGSSAGGSSASESSSSTSSSGGGSSSRRSQQDGSPPAAAAPPVPAVRRGSSKRLLRPDSLLIYRQKSRGEGAEEARTGLVRRLFLGSSVKERPLLSLAPPAGRTQDATPQPQRLDPRSRTGLHRSQSDISSRYSRSFSDFDTFFKYCGLEPEVVEELGRERFAAAAPEESSEAAGQQQQHRIRSASVATSDSGFSRRSGEDSTGGLQEDEPLGGGQQLPGAGGSNTSVIERNARIIKWLYSCKRAKETRGASPDLP